MDGSYSLTDPSKDTISIEFETEQLLDLLSTADPTSPVYRHASSILDARLVQGTYQVHNHGQPGPRKLLTIGMASHDDYDGVYFSVQALRLYHPEIADETEILVIDNHPGGPAAEALRSLENWVKGYRYIPFDRVQGTAVRDLIFREASADFVLCMDCHVLFAPGSLRELLSYLRAHPDSNNLLQGPMVSDDLTTLATHFDPVWSAGMWGVWGCDERALDPQSPPFEIPMQGLGVFACRKDTWPGLNPRLRGFGGEEGCLHEKFRQRDATTLCLPFLRWLHRFERPIGPSYQTTWEDRIRNYLILFDELGMDATPVVQHFEELLGTESAHSIAEAVTKEIANPFSFFDAIYCVNLDRDTARWEQVRERFQELGISGRVRRFPAIETPHSHHIGCALSHRAIIAEARRLALGNVLVFEDDVIFAADTLAVLEGAIQELRQQTWWMLFLGGHTWGESYPKANACEFLEVPGGMTCSHAVAYNHTIYDRILADIPESPSEVALWLRVHYGIDQYFKNALGEFRLVTRPVIATQPTILSEEKRPFSETYLARHADWSEYYELAEADVFSQWRLIQAFIGEEPRLDLTAVLDFACGRGRIAERFAAIAGSLICSDINAEALACCRQRFANSPNVTCVINDGLSIPLPDESLTFVYSWDSMVNFNAAELRTYLREFKRILRPGGMALVHHSNYAALGSPARVWNENPACRAYVSASDVGMICDQYALPIVRQQVIDWTEPSLDCLTMFRKPGAPARDRLDRTVPKLPGSVSKGANRHGMRFGFIDPYITYGPRDVHESALGGTETSFVLLAEALQALGHEAIVYLKDPGCSEFNGVHYRGLSDARSISHDAVLARWPELFDDLDAKAGRRIWWCHKAVDPESTQMARTVNAFPVVTSQYQARQLADLGWCDRFAVIPLGCRIRHSPRHRRKPFTAVWISAFDHGLDTLIDIWRSIRRQLPRGSELIIAGGPTVYREYGGYLVEWEQRLRYETRDEPDILWRGPVAPGELSKLLSIAGILPYASNIAETFCLSVLEAQAAGCLPIVTPYGALTERIVHGETGWIESEDRLGERILDYSRRAGSPDVARMRRAAKRSAEGFTWATVARQIEDEMLS